MIDFHSHVLPAIDDGSQSVEESMEMLRALKRQGVDTVVATSHFYATHRSPQSYVQHRDAAFEELKQVLTDDCPRIILGAEVLYFPGISHMDELGSLCIEGTDLLLLEMPFNRWSEGLLDSVEAISDDEDFRIVLAHVDRYDRKAVEQLFRLNHVKGQVNADNLKRRFGMRYLREWAREGLIVAVGSDIHGTETGYVDWLTCQRRYAEDWAAIMKRTNRRLGPLLETASKQEAEANGARP
jgi:protein-tyrosine phosphatase